MTPDPQDVAVSRDRADDPPCTRLRLVVRLFVVAMVLLGLDFAFWFTADFRGFVPPCDGPWTERLYFAGITASGPWVMGVINRWSLGGWLNAAFLSAIVVVMGLPAVLRPHRMGARFAAYVAVVLWFFFGFCGSGLRIT
jgi:hypothetical protein